PFRTHREMMTEWLEKYSEQIGKKPSRQSAEIHIRPFTVKDTDSVLSLLMTIANNRSLTHEEMVAVALRMAELDSVEVYVAETGEIQPSVIGYISLTIIRGLTDSVGMVSSMAVSPTYQRRGVGAELLEAVMRRATQLNLRALWVDTSQANNQARAFYAALGFEDLEILRLKLR
ncbi:MAG: GNAT family N-acetyltransferase, partial [Chloroflexota bacterium]